MDAETPRQALEFSSDEMREIGYRVIDMLVDYHDGRAEKPVWKRWTLTC